MVSVLQSIQEVLQQAWGTEENEALLNATTECLNQLVLKIDKDDHIPSEDIRDFLNNHPILTRHNVDNPYHTLLDHKFTEPDKVKVSLDDVLRSTFSDPGVSFWKRLRRWSLPVFLPSSWPVVYWGIVSLCIILIDSLVIPYELAYLNAFGDHAWFWFGTLFFSIDILLNFNVAVTTHPSGTLTTSRIAIAKRYLMTWFLIDLISTIPFDNLLSPQSGSGVESVRLTRIAKLSKLTRCIRLTRLLKLIKIQNIFAEIDAMIGSFLVVHILKLVFVLIEIAYICHWNACIFWVIGHPETYGDTEESGTYNMPHWTTTYYSHYTFRQNGSPTHFRWVDQPPHEAYVFCFYWTLGVMRTMPTEVYPVNYYERIYTMCFMFFAFSVFAICVTRITSMVSKISYRQNEFNESMSSLNEWMRYQKVNPPLQNRVRDYLKFVFLKKRLFGKQDLLMSELSQTLVSELNLEIYGVHLRRCWVFTALPDSILTHIALLCSTYIIAPQEVVVTTGEIGVKVWFLMSGKLLCENEPIESVNGESLLVTCDWFSSITVVSDGFSELACLRKDDFLELCQAVPELGKYTNIQSPGGPDGPDSHRGLKRKSSPSYIRTQSDHRQENARRLSAPDTDVAAVIQAVS